MAEICPVCDKKVIGSSNVIIGEVIIHAGCIQAFRKDPEKYGGKAETGWGDLDKAPSNSEPSDKDFVITLLICVFLGGLGVHRFFVDKMGTGALMLVTFGGLGIWWIIDIILIVTGSFEDSEGRVIAYQPAGTANREPAKDIPAEIRKFAELKKDGLISEEEFDKKKEELLR